MDETLGIGEVAYSKTLKCDVICIEDDFGKDGKYGCDSCVFGGKNHDCLSDMFTDKFECRCNFRPDRKDVHFIKYGQNK